MRSGKHYKKITTPDGRKMDEHRYKMELKLGRRLTRFEIVHHVDEDINNNDIENLRLMSLAEHTRHHLVGVSRDGIKSNRKLNEDQVIEIREKYLAGKILKELGREYNVNYSTISLIINFRSFPKVDRNGLKEKLEMNKKPQQLCKYKNRLRKTAK